MKRNLKIYLMAVIWSLLNAATALAQTMPQGPQALGLRNNWIKSDLLRPADLAALLERPQVAKPLIFNIGVVDNIKGARHTGAASEKPGLARFKKALSTVPKDATIVIYCGCCPFARCPNIRPAFQVLKDQGFRNGKLLDLPNNIKTDWIDKGYPMAE